MVVYDARIWEAEQLRQRLAALPRGSGEAEGIARRIEIPVCCDAAYALDLKALATHAGCTPAEFVAAFVKPVYCVAFLGFTPGFPYLTGLPEALAMPRRATPQPHIEAGSVGIAGMQAGIYPAESPGGWQIVGRTPLRLFDVSRTPMSLVEPGDELRFVSITSREFEEPAAR
jgi:inhibitor of KinA